MSINDIGNQSKLIKGGVAPYTGALVEMMTSIGSPTSVFVASYTTRR